MGHANQKSFILYAGLAVANTIMGKRCDDRVVKGRVESYNKVSLATSSAACKTTGLFAGGMEEMVISCRARARNPVLCHRRFLPWS